MKTEEVTEPAPVIDPANEATPETLPEMELLPRGANYQSNLRGTNVKQWFSAAPLSSRE
jgi:hypothetical protein